MLRETNELPPAAIVLDNLALLVWNTLRCNLAQVGIPAYICLLGAVT